MPILITGGNGLLGSWVTYYFAQKGKDVVSFDLKPRSFDYLEEYQDHVSFHKRRCSGLVKPGAGFSASGE